MTKFCAHILILPLLLAATPAAPSSAADQPRFAACQGGHRVTCVVDGDTFWLDGTKIRIADINAPEVSHPSCAYEAQLGARATQRLTDLLNAGEFTLATQGRATDRYGRALRVVLRRQRSVGMMLQAEGLAEAWTGHRRNWCLAG
jgi:endonuclease YncB( thermonuclease family)